jgi:hypothetical protein
MDRPAVASDAGIRRTAPRPGAAEDLDFLPVARSSTGLSGQVSPGLSSRR